MNKFDALMQTLDALDRIDRIQTPAKVDISAGNKLLITMEEPVSTPYDTPAGTFRYTIRIRLYDHKQFSVTLNWSEMSSSIKHYVQQAGINASTIKAQWEGVIRGN